MNEEKPNRSVFLIIKNTLFNLLSGISGKALNLILVPLQARYLGPNGYGILTYGVSVSSLMGVATELGLDRLMIKEVAQSGDNPSFIMSAALTIKGITGTIGFIVTALILLHFAPYTVATHVAIILLFGALITSVISTFQALFAGIEKFEYLTIMTIVSRLLSIAIAIIILMYLKKGAILYSISMVASGIPLLLMAYVLAKKSGKKIHFSIPSLKEMRSLLSLSFFFFLASLTGTTFTYVDSVMLHHLINADAVAFYQSAYKLVLATFIIPSAITTAAYPSLSKMITTDKEKALFLTRNLIRLLSIIAIPVAVWISLYTNEIITVLYGKEYEQSARCLAPMIWFGFLSYSYFSITTLLQSSGNQKDNVKISATGGIANIIANFILIPSFGILGAVYATLMSRIIVFILCFYYAYKAFPSQGWGKDLPLVTLVTLLTYSTGQIFLSSNALLGAAVIVFIWLGFSLLLRGIRQSDLESMKKLFKERSKQI
jgi:O-antigen/teichoic acid export membrane protein